MSADKLPAELPAELQDIASRLGELGQQHIVDDWPAAGDADADKVRCLRQLLALDGSYPGGLAAYVKSARTLLAASSRGENPLEGWKPSVPEDGFDIAPGGAEFEDFEQEGLQRAGELGFVVPAGGLGERLGYSGVKFALPSEISSGASVLGVYCGYIRALQRLVERSAADEGDGKGDRAVSAELPLAIMVSADTEAGIQKLLEENAYYGLRSEQITLLKQEKVAALRDASGAFAMADAYTIATKPHGHGDVHFLLHSSGTARRWHAQGVRWLHFFQDTNTLYFSNFLATLGVSSRHNVAVNLVATPRKAKEAIGAVCRLAHTDGRTMVANVEYNQLEPLLLASGFEAGDANEADGYSRFPGNINQIIINLDSWLDTVEQHTGGAIAEFINPKYTDSTRTAFKSPTRLECMMQDYVKTVEPSQKVAWTRYPHWLGYFPCKNDIVSAAKLSASGVPPHSASSSEMAVYHFHAMCLRTLGASVGDAVERTYRGVRVSVGPSIVFAPSFAPCFSLLKAKLPSPEKVRVSARSTLLVSGEDVTIEQLDLDGALVIEVADGGKLLIESLSVTNDGWDFDELDDAAHAGADEALAIRGYSLSKKAEGRKLVVAAGEAFTVTNGKARRSTITDLHTAKSMKRIDAQRKASAYGFAQPLGSPTSPTKPSDLAIVVEQPKGCACAVM